MTALTFVDYRRFAASLLLTSIGLQLIQVAVFWQVYELTGSALLLGLTGLARAAPHMVLSLMGGVVADRFNRVRLIQAGQAANGIVVVILGVLTVTESVEVWHLYAVAFALARPMGIGFERIIGTVERKVPKRASRAAKLAEPTSA